MRAASLVALAALSAAAVAAAAAPGRLHGRAVTLAEERDCDAEPDTCDSSCLDRMNAARFLNNECLGTGDAVINTTTLDFVDGATNPYSYFPSRSDDLATVAGLDALCGGDCTSTVVDYAVTFAKARRCYSGAAFSDSAEDDYFTNGLLGAYFASTAESSCLKAGSGRYCQVVLQEAVGGLPKTRFTELSDAEQCDALAYAGCCVPAIVALQNVTLIKDSPVYNQHGDVAAYEAAIARCGYGSLEGCPLPGESAIYTPATLTLADGNFSLLAADDDLRREFEVAFATDVADAIDALPPQVEIADVRNGSVIVDVRVRGNVKEALNGALADGIALDKVDAVAGFEGLAAIGAASASVGNPVEVANDLDASPAFAARSWPLAWAALAALAAVLAA